MRYTNLETIKITPETVTRDDETLEQYMNRMSKLIVGD